MLLLYWLVIFSAVASLAQKISTNAINGGTCMHNPILAATPSWPVILCQFVGAVQVIFIAAIRCWRVSMFRA